MAKEPFAQLDVWEQCAPRLFDEAPPKHKAEPNVCYALLLTILDTRLLTFLANDILRRASRAHRIAVFLK
jgi:hypothetical protein